MRTKKTVPALMVLLFLMSLMMTPMLVHASPAVTVSVEMPDGYIPEKSVGSKWWVYFQIDASELTYNGADGIVFWAVDVKVDPSVLSPFMAKAGSGFLLTDFADQNFYPMDHPVFAWDSATGVVEGSSMWFATDLAVMSGGAATTDEFGNLPTPYRLFAVAYEVVGSGSTMFDITKAEYTNFGAPATKINMDHVECWYGEPVVPEFPLGSVAPIALIAAIAYIWWVTRRKRQEMV